MFEVLVVICAAGLMDTCREERSAPMWGYEACQHEALAAQIETEAREAENGAAVSVVAICRSLPVEM